MLRIAQLSADEDGNLQGFFGIRWTNAITLPASIGSFLMLLVGPLFGSIADFTSYRKLFGAVAMILTILCTLTNVFISSETLGFVLVCTTLQTVTYLCVYSMYRAAYLPELASSEDEVTKLSAKGYVILFVSQMSA